jgi:hypothetical protein
MSFSIFFTSLSLLTSFTSQEMRDLSWIKPGHNVYVLQGGYLVPGHRAGGYAATVLYILSGGRFKVKATLSRSSRVEYGHHIYKSMEDSPELATHQPVESSAEREVETLKQKVLDGELSSKMKADKISVAHDSECS